MATITIEVPDELSELIAQAGERLPELLKQTLQQPLFRNSVVADLTRRGKIKLNQNTIAKMAASYQS